MENLKVQNILPWNERKKNEEIKEQQNHEYNFLRW